jgi:hypothetical protein
MEDREFKLEILRLVLELGSPQVSQNPLQFADNLLRWCVKPIDKSDGEAEKPRRGRSRKADLSVVKSGQSDS